VRDNGADTAMKQGNEKHSIREDETPSNLSRFFAKSNQSDKTTINNSVPREEPNGATKSSESYAKIEYAYR
jgi:hypothetical protein